MLSWFCSGEGAEGRAEGLAERVMGLIGLVNKSQMVITWETLQLAPYRPHLTSLSVCVAERGE